MAGSPVELTARYVVTGLVQGVGFRYFVLRRAVRLGLRGWTRNLPDGRVEVVAKGPAAAHSALADALGTGPAGARVAAVEKSEISDEVDAITSFEIR